VGVEVVNGEDRKTWNWKSVVCFNVLSQNPADYTDENQETLKLTSLLAENASGGLKIRSGRIRINKGSSPYGSHARTPFTGPLCSLSVSPSHESAVLLIKLQITPRLRPLTSSGCRRNTDKYVWVSPGLRTHTKHELWPPLLPISYTGGYLIAPLCGDVFSGCYVQ
jgi:hypothetical protein